jgi:hypothetical protein
MTPSNYFATESKKLVLLQSVKLYVYINLENVHSLLILNFSVKRVPSL